jgi:hypothetical protein
MIFYTGSRETLLADIAKIHRDNYNSEDISFIESAIQDVLDLFEGKRKGFNRADTRYHDLTHTLQTVPPFIEIIDGWNRQREKQPISKTFFNAGLVAVLLHDTGYIRREGDNLGTGAKYTFVHIQRSADFAGEYLRTRGFGEDLISSVQKAIRCTGVRLDRTVCFNSEEEQVIGYALGSADLLGQMSAPDYVSKLPILYDEFSEAYRHQGIEKLRKLDVRVFESAEDLIRSTPSFYEVLARTRFQAMGSLQDCISLRYDGRRNPYIEAIESNVAAIRALYP